MEPATQTDAGRVLGTVFEDTFVFRGIPFAAPPVGEHRFGSPAPVEPWDGIRDATRFGPTAPQADPIGTIIPEPVEHGDDCLNLNVFTPDLSDAQLPVLVWIHGGGFVSGCNRSPWYRGTRFARDGVVVVTLGYRLGVEGFCDIEGAPANRGVLDWIAGLEWVQRNISSFGGDPSRITIAGQSAGSAACLVLLANPRARGMFGRVIAMSGTSDTRMTREAAGELTRRIAEHLGVAPTREELAGFSPAELVAANTAAGRNPFTADALTSTFDPRSPALKPFVDGEVIASHPFRDIASGVGADVPLVAGSTTEEINGLMRMRRAEIGTDGARRSLAAMGLEGDALATYMTSIGTDDVVEALGQAATDRAFRTPLARLLEDRAALGAPTYAYQFAWRPASFDGAVGAAHCLDIPFAWDNLDADGVADGLIGEGAPQELADEMHGSWVRFVRGGSPGWPAYGDGGRAVNYFDMPSAVREDGLATVR